MAKKDKTKKVRWKLTDEHLKKIDPIFPKPKKSKKGGRPPIDNRRVFEGVLWVLRTGAPWEDVPKKYGSGTTCWRRLRDWEEQGLWEKAWRMLLGELDDKGCLHWNECFIDGSFASAKKGGLLLEAPSAAREQSGWWWWTVKAFLSECSWRLPRHTKRIRPNKPEPLAS